MASFVGSRIAPLAAMTFAALLVVGCSSSKGEDDQGGSAGGGSGGDTGTGGIGGRSSGGAQGQAGGSGGAVGATGGSGGASGGQGGGQASGGTGGATANTGGTGGTGGVKSAVAFAADFEDGVVGQFPPSPFSGTNQAIKVDSTRAYSGTKSIKVVSASGSTLFSLPGTKSNLPVPRKTAYTRFMVYLDNLPAENTAPGTPPYHWDLLKYTGVFKGGGFNVAGFISYGGFGTSGQKVHMFGDDTTGKGRQDCVKQDGFILKAKEWTCIEFKSDEKDIINYGVSINGEEQQALSFLYDSAASQCVPDWNILQGTWYPPEISVFQFGFNHVNHSPAPVTLWIDDVAISTKPIGCPPKP